MTRHISYLALALVFVAAQAATAAEVSSLKNAHSHNDYHHTRPLFDALDQGFCSVEADIFLVDGELLIGHDRKELTPERTLESLYLKPLAERAKRFNGRIFPDAKEFVLWIEFKTDGNEVYPFVYDTLAKYKNMITHFTPDGKRVNRGVDVIISGSIPRELIQNEKRTRFMSIDGRAGDFDSDISADFVPVISNAWKDFFKWNGEGEMPAAERALLAEHVSKAAAHGRKLRYWGAPDTENIWKMTFDAGVFFINTDKLPELREFLVNAAPVVKKTRRRVMRLR
ncbi:MAG: phosphatidylinositol-specific phospholipase C/glycerophosphodiester phosphodiesterase family protein [Thermoguttaceae bacterium]